MIKTSVVVWRKLFNTWSRNLAKVLIFLYFYVKTVQKLIVELVKQFSEGIPQLNITSLDPFYLNEYLMHFESTQIEGKSLFKDVYNQGLGSIKIIDVR